MICFTSLILTLLLCNETRTPEERRNVVTIETQSTMPSYASKITIGFALWLMFASTMGFSLIEIMITPIVADKWGMLLTESSIPFAIAGFFLFATAVTMRIITSPFECNGNKALISDRFATLTAFVFLLCGSTLMTDFTSLTPDPCRTYDNNINQCLNHTNCIWNPISTGRNCDTCGYLCWSKEKQMNYYQFLVGFCCSNVGFQIARITIGTMTGKIIPKILSPTVMALIIIAQGLSRAVTPIFSMQLYDIHHTTFYMMTTIGIMYLVSLFIIICKYQQLDRTFYLNVEKYPLITN